MQNSNFKSSLGSILLGIGIGSVIGVLFAPDKGSKTRQKISSKGEDLMNNANDSLNRVAEGARSTVSKVTEGAKSIYNEVADTARSVYNEATKDAKSAYNSASDEVKKDAQMVKDKAHQATEHSNNHSGKH